MIPKEQYAAIKEKFTAYYKAELEPILQKNDRQRKKYLRSFWLLLLMSAVFYPLAIGLTFWLMIKMEDIDTGPFFFISGIFIMILYAPIHKYKKATKIDIMPKFAKFFGDFKYDFERTVDDLTLKNSKLFQDFSINKADDYFAGRYQDVNIIIAEEKLQNEAKFSDASKVTVFRGICILLEMNKPFKGQTVALQDKGLFNIFQRSKGLENVRLEDSLFEKEFEVYADDQIEARYLLTTAFMERMLKLRKLYAGKNIQFSFFNNKLLIAIATKQDMFETGTLFKTSPDKKQIEIAFEQFYTVCSVVNILKLNQHIGM